MRIDDHSFSELLRLHASSLDLEVLAPVGDWEFGQSIRRAKKDSYFFDLTEKGFYPFGINHPLMLRSPVTASSPAPFSDSLVTKLTELAGYKWIVLTDQSYQQFKQNKKVHECRSFTLNSIWGIRDLASPSAETVSVRLSDGCFFVFSSHELPDSDTLVHHGWLNLFLSTEVLGPSGRLASVQNWLKDIFQLTHIDGLSFSFPANSTSLANLGLGVDPKGEQEISLHFPVSVLKNDLELIHTLLTRKDVLC